MIATPAFLKDAKELLTEKGFATSNIWYHGTSSALVVSIKQQGLKRSGDQAIREAAKQTMATIGNTYTETTEPVFLTPSKELAYYWARQTQHNRSLRIQGSEEPVVFELRLPEELNAKVNPDVGAASLLLLKEGENYLAHLASIYHEKGLEVPEVDLMKAQRMDYLKLLGMAYIDEDIPADYIRLLG